MHANELLDVVFRWAHLIAGIMWIGNSMLFNWLDRNLVAPGPGAGKLSQGKIFMVHSGAFYDVEKKLLAPGELPDEMHWFKWQNFTTWATGISLMVVVYYMNGAAFLVDPSVRAMGQGEAIAWSLGSLVAAWAVYDGVWMTVGKRAPSVATALSFVLLFVAAYGFTLLFSGRAAYVQTGVLIGTMMTGNVWMRILPSQRSLIAATKAGREQDATLSLRAKQRSIHNNYLTFPLLVHHDLQPLPVDVRPPPAVLPAGDGDDRRRRRASLHERALRGARLAGAGAGDGQPGDRRAHGGDAGPRGAGGDGDRSGVVRAGAGDHRRALRAVPQRQAHRRPVRRRAEQRHVRHRRADPGDGRADQGSRLTNKTMPFLNKTNITAEERAELGPGSIKEPSSSDAHRSRDPLAAGGGRGAGRPGGDPRRRRSHRRGRAVGRRAGGRGARRRRRAGGACPASSTPTST
jgi:hypothetical protein